MIQTARCDKSQVRNAGESDVIRGRSTRSAAGDGTFARASAQLPGRMVRLPGVTTRPYETSRSFGGQNST